MREHYVRELPSELGAAPLSIQQEQRLAFEELARESGQAIAPFNVVDGMRLRGALDEVRLAEALWRVVGRHSVLRTRLTQRYGMPAAARRYQLDTLQKTGTCPPGLYEQTVQHGGLVPLHAVDLTRAAPDVREARLSELLFDQSAAGFDYAKPPLLRATLVRCSPQNHVLVLAAPHLVCDTESLQVLWRDLLDLYDGHGEEPPMLPMPAQFHEFARWQAEQLFTPYFDADVAYWRERWAELAPAQIDPAHLPYAHPEGARSALGAFVEARGLTPELGGRVRKCCSELAVAPYVWFFAAFMVFLARATGRTHVATWITCPNRVRDETDDAVGWFMNAHAVDVLVDERQSVTDFVESCRRSVLDVLRHQEMPLPVLWHRLRRRYQRLGPLVAFDWRTSVVQREGPLDASPLRVTARRVAFSMGACVRVVEHGETFTIRGVHSVGQFEPAAVQTALQGFAGVVRQFAEDPERALGSVR